MISLLGQSIRKRYGATIALNGLNLSVNSGRIVGIAGPNGAGKSTLTRMLGGEETPDSGEIVLVKSGQVVADAWRRVAVVHQEPQVWPNLTVMENLAVGRESRFFGGVTIPRNAKGVLERLDIVEFADFDLSDLTLAVQQRVEIARAILSGADVFLFDEPNSALTEEESAALFETMAELARDDKIVLLITHRLNDFVRFCERVLILRDGEIGADIGLDNLTEAVIAAELMAGTRHRVAREAGVAAPAKAVGKAEPVLRLRSCSDHKSAFNNVTFDVIPGQILALTGVEGSGARELAQAIGVQRPVRDANTIVRPNQTSYLAASRRQTVFHNLSVAENLISRLDWPQLSTRLRTLDFSKIRKTAASGLQRYRIKAGDTNDPITSLSGGNQQKVMLGALIEQQANLLVIEEPTRGVDISSKADIYELLRAYAARGNAVLLFCTEVQEVFEAADSVKVLVRGQVAATLDVSASPTLEDLASALATYEAD
jgi:ABC-type sugar transport system ATPase subunit